VTGHRQEAAQPKPNARAHRVNVAAAYAAEMEEDDEDFQFHPPPFDLQKQLGRAAQFFNKARFSAILLYLSFLIFPNQVFSLVKDLVESWLLYTASILL
jgi:hypothetical protein